MLTHDESAVCAAPRAWHLWEVDELDPEDSFNSEMSSCMRCELRYRSSLT